MIFLSPSILRLAAGMGAGGGDRAAVRLACKPQGLQKEFDFADGVLGHYASLWSPSWSLSRAHAEQLWGHSLSVMYAGTGASWRRREGTGRAVAQHQQCLAVLQGAARKQAKAPGESLQVFLWGSTPAVSRWGMGNPKPWAMACHTLEAIPIATSSTTS